MEELYKGYIIWRDKVYCHYHVKLDGKGRVPEVLEGSYTRLDMLKNAIDRYREQVPLESAPKTAKV